MTDKRKELQLHEGRENWQMPGEGLVSALK